MEGPMENPKNNPKLPTGLSSDWGSGSHSQVGDGIALEELSEAGTELAVEDGAADLEQEIGAAVGPAHLLGFVHAAVDQEVGRAFRDRRADPQAGTMASASLTSQAPWLVR